MKNKVINITDYDFKKLNNLLQTSSNNSDADNELLDKLRVRLNEAKITSQKEIPPYLVTMNCHVRVTDLNEKKDIDIWLVYPDGVMFGDNKVSIISEIGISILGLKVGDIAEFGSNGKKKYLRIAQIYYQPEESKHYKL